jgi:hypothetical protein
MTNIGDIYNFFNFVTDKYRNGYISPEEFSAALDVAQNTLWQNYIGKRNSGNELALIALRPFYDSSTVTTNSSGFVLYPSLYAEMQAVYTSIDGVKKNVRDILYNELTDALDSVIYPVAKYPVYIKKQTGIVYYPLGVKSLDIEYIKKPTTPVMGYTTTTNSIVYNPVTSVQLQFDTQYYYEIILLAMPYVGVNLSNQEVSGLIDLFTINKDNGSDGN